MSIFVYKRPSFVPTEPGYINAQSCQRYVERAATNGGFQPVPDELAFNSVMDNKTQPPVALGDFMDYLIYVAKDAENLQFFLWYRDYCTRFMALDESARRLSPEWKGTTENIIEATKGSWPLEDDDFAMRPITSHSNTSNREYITALPSENDGPDGSEYDYKTFVDRSVQTHQKHMSNADEMKKTNRAAGADWPGFSIQPFRPEIIRIITHYFASSAPRRLNLAPAISAQVLHALQHTTHPSAFDAAIALITPYLKHHSHPNFIRWSICNGNKPRVYFVRSQGILWTCVGFMLALLLTLSSVERWWRVFSAVLWFIGISTLIAAFNGLCLILHTNHQRAVRPWEDPAALYSTFTGGVADDEDGNEARAHVYRVHSSRITDIEMEKDLGSSRSVKSTDGKSVSVQSSLDTFGDSNDSYIAPGTNNWVTRYEKKNLLKKVFEKSVMVKDSGVRVMQDRIARMAQAWALVFTIILTIAFTALPRGNFY